MSSDAYAQEQFNEDYKRFDEIGSSVEEVGTESLRLLMKGKYYVPLADLLENEKTSAGVALQICNYFIREGNAEEYDIVEQRLAGLTKSSINHLAFFRELENHSHKRLKPVEVEKRRRPKYSRLVEFIVILSVCGLKFFISIFCAFVMFVLVLAFVSMLAGPPHR